MTDLDAAIRAKLADRPALEASELPGERARDVNGWISHATQAIEAVLDEHKPMDGWDTDSLVCTCLPDYDDTYMAHAYPCPSLRALAGKLGVEVDG